MDTYRLNDEDIKGTFTRGFNAGIEFAVKQVRKHSNTYTVEEILAALADGKYNLPTTESIVLRGETK